MLVGRLEPVRRGPGFWGALLAQLVAYLVVLAGAWVVVGAGAALLLVSFAAFAK